eukprot:11571740-Ditylum_brightwellii.AAC.1
MKPTGGHRLKIHGEGDVTSPTVLGTICTGPVPKKDTWCKTMSEECTLFWNQEKFRQTLTYDHATRVLQFYSAPGTIIYHLLAAYMEADLEMECKEKVCFKIIVLSDDEEGDKATAAN